MLMRDTMVIGSSHCTGRLWTRLEYKLVNANRVCPGMSEKDLLPGVRLPLVNIWENLAGIKFGDFRQNTIFQIWWFGPPTKILCNHHEVEPHCLMATCHLKSWEKCPVALAGTLSVPYLHILGQRFRVCLIHSSAIRNSFPEREKNPTLHSLESVQVYFLKYYYQPAGTAGFNTGGI